MSAPTPSDRRRFRSIRPPCSTAFAPRSRRDPLTEALIDYTVTDGQIARITLDDPARRNALSDELLDQLLAALGRARDDDQIRVVVLGTSHERIFSAGGDLKAFASDSPVIEKYAGLDRFPRLFALIGGLHQAGHLRRGR